MQILLLQARDDDDPMIRHELECFEEQTGLPSEYWRTINMAHEPAHTWSLDGADLVMIGGSGDYSVSKGGFEWHQPMLDLMHDILSHNVPMFASCFGFQVLVQALGGEVVNNPDAAEVGTFEMTCTAAAKEDALFSQLPPTFDAQLGHNDSVAKLPNDVVHLASSERCEFQAIRVADRMVWATQFHPELSMADNMMRYERYLVNYAKEPMTPEEAHEHSLSIHRPTPVANGLLKRFLDTL